MNRTFTNTLLTLIGLSLLGCSPEKDTIGNGASPKEVMQADYVVVKPQTVVNSISVTGTLNAAESAMLSAQTSGLIKSIYFKEGAKVSKGQLLVKLDDRQWQAQRKKLEAQLLTAQKDVERKTQLLDIKGISQAEVDEASLQIENIEADKQELDVMIDLAGIRAPFSGRIGLRNVSLGSYLGAGDPVARLVQVDVLKLEFNVPERYASQIRKGQKVSFSVAGNDASFAGTVYATEPVISETTRSLRIRANVPNKDGKLIAGAFAEVELSLDSIPDAMLLPTEAVIPKLNDLIVYQIKDGMVKEVKVTLGVRRPRLVQIKQGLVPGDTIMVVGLLQAKDGMPVQAGTEVAVEKFEN